MSSAQQTSKWSPGPIYNYRYDQKYASMPSFGFGTCAKNPLELKPYHCEEAVTVCIILTNLG